MARGANPLAVVRDNWGAVPVGDVVLQVTVDDEIIARLDVYWEPVKVDGEPVEAAWIDHVWTHENYENMGFGSALVAAAHLVAAREVEWAALYPAPGGWYERFGYFHPDGAEDDLLVAPLTGQPQTWPPGRIEVTRPAVEV